MRPRSVLLAASAAATAAAVVVRRRGSRRERVELAYADGSTLVLDGGSPAGARLVAAARDMLAAARG
jgi:hypothetical protein